MGRRESCYDSGARGCCRLPIVLIDERRGRGVAQQEIESAAREIAAAEALLITAGAGMGVDSGLPDFRGVDGFWRAYPAFAKLGVRFEEMANPAWFGRDPSLAWGF